MLLEEDLPSAAGLPAGSVSGLSKEQASSLARSVADEYRKGRQKKRLRDLTAEKYMMHIHGEGDAQSLDIVHGSRLAPAPNLDGGIRAQSNLLRPIVGNFVAHHTSIPFRVIAEKGGDRRSVDRATVDTVWANDLILRQRLNELVSDALHIACAYGNCPLFASWREDMSHDPYEPVYSANGEYKGIVRPGFIDCWVGDPWGMVYNTGATRRSVHSATYERILPMSLIRKAFFDAHELYGTDIKKLKGSTKLASAGRFQLTAGKWRLAGGSVHGSAAIHGGPGGEELGALVCKEILPGVDDDYPEGRLIILVLDGVGESEERFGTPWLVHEGPLPGGRFSFVRFYSMDGFDDVHGKPFVSDLDDLQVLRNNLESLLLNGAHRAAHPMAYMGPGAADDDTAAFVPDGILEVHSGIQPGYFQYPTQWMVPVRAQIQDVESAMFRIGAWQAASRGESRAGDAAAKTVALARADDTILGPANRGVHGSLVEFLGLCHALTKQHAGDFPIPIRIAGQDYGHLRKDYIRAGEMGEEPRFVVVSGSATPESRNQQLLNLIQVKGADGQPLLTTAQLRKQYADPSIWPFETDITETKQRRAQAVNYAIRDAVNLFRDSNPDWDEEAFPPHWKEQAVQYAAQQIFLGMKEEYREIARDDDPQMHINARSELTQDMSEDLLVRKVAALQQDLYYQWLAQQQPQPQAQPVQQPGGPQPAYATTGGQFGGSATSDQMANVGGEVAALTRAAAQGAA